MNFSGNSIRIYDSVKFQSILCFAERSYLEIYNRNETWQKSLAGKKWQWNLWIVLLYYLHVTIDFIPTDNT